MTEVIPAVGTVNTLAQNDLDTNLYHKQPQPNDPNINGLAPMNTTVTQEESGAETPMDLNNDQRN